MTCCIELRRNNINSPKWHGLSKINIKHRVNFKFFYIRPWTTGRKWKGSWNRDYKKTEGEVVVTEICKLLARLEHQTDFIDKDYSGLRVYFYVSIYTNIVYFYYTVDGIGTRLARYIRMFIHDVVGNFTNQKPMLKLVSNKWQIMSSIKPSNYFHSIKNKLNTKASYTPANNSHNWILSLNIIHL